MPTQYSEDHDFSDDLGQDQPATSIEDSNENGEIHNNFASLSLPEELLDAVSTLGFVTATPIQAQAIPLLMQGHDLVGIAQTGTGKTAAFGLPLLANVDPKIEKVQALVLAPTRELAGQTRDALKSFSHHIDGLRSVVVYGGAPYGPQIRALKEGAQVVVGTPGRIMDLLDKGALDISNVAFFVLDEADEMLKMGFAEDVDKIASFLPKERLTALFSATMPKAIEKVSARHLRNPKRITITPPSSTVQTVSQSYAVVPYKYKTVALGRILLDQNPDGCIVFVKTRSAADEVYVALAAQGLAVAALTGDVAQKEREKIVSRLRDGSLQVVVATDVAARGLDVERVTLVVNYDIPSDPNSYVHRIGRTGRAGRSGEAIAFFTPKESSRLRQIEKTTGATLELREIPSPAQVQRSRCERILSKITSQSLNNSKDLADIDQVLGEFLKESSLDAYQVALGLLALQIGTGKEQDAFESPITGGRIRREEHLDEQGRFLRAEFEGGRDKKSKTRRSRHDDGDYTRYRIEVGRKDRVRPSDIVGAITAEGGVSGSMIGRIDILATFSLVDMQSNLNRETLRRIAQARLAGRTLRIRQDNGPKPKKDGRKDRFSEGRSSHGRRRFQGR